MGIINIKKCMLEPACNKKIKRSARKSEMCNDCTKCGWNVDVIAKRMAKWEVNNNGR